MPFIDAKISMPVSDEKKEILKNALGQFSASIGKSEQWTMIGIDDNYDLWFSGNKMEKAAYVTVSLYGSAASDSYNKMTGQICSLLEDVLGIPADNIYISYHPVHDWGWNGENF